MFRNHNKRRSNDVKSNRSLERDSPFRHHSLFCACVRAWVRYGTECSGDFPEVPARNDRTARPRKITIHHNAPCFARPRNSRCRRHVTNYARIGRTSVVGKRHWAICGGIFARRKNIVFSESEGGSNDAVESSTS